jgi:hypothetical protein
MVESDNQIFLLSKSKNKYCEIFLKTIANTVIIYDTEIDDKDLKNQNYCCLTETVKKISAWDKAIYYIANNLHLIDKYKHFYFIEDDVYTNNLEIFNTLFNVLNKYDSDLIAHDIKSQKKSSTWNWWIKYKTYTAKSYNPLCRLSNKIILLIIDYHKKNKTLLFHEVLFASLAFDNNLKTLDLTKIEEYKNLFGIFRYRPIINAKNINDNKIYHPVKPNYENI